MDFYKSAFESERTKGGFLFYKEKVKAMLDKIKNYFTEEIDAVRRNDPAARSAFEVVTLYPGFHAILLHRPAHWLYGKRAYYPARLLSQLSRFITGIEIHPGAKLGKGILIDHGSGVVIGETAEIGDYCILYQGVTLGGTGKECGKRHPTLGERVIVGAGAKVLGPFSIGSGAKIASNAVVLESLPEGATAVGVPARVVRVNGKKVAKPLDHADIPDPVANEFKRVNQQLEQMTQRLSQLEAQNLSLKQENQRLAKKHIKSKNSKDRGENYENL